MKFKIRVVGSATWLEYSKVKVYVVKEHDEVTK